MSVVARRLLPILPLLLGAALGGCAAAGADDATQSEDAINSVPWTTEAEVADSAKYDKVLEYNDHVLQRGSFQSDHGKWQTTRQGPRVDIAYAIARASNEKGAIVVVNGRTETFSQYAELVYDLHRRGYSLYLIDHRGQGHSSRLVDYATIGDDEYEKGFVDEYQHYVDDLDKFIRTVVLPDRQGKSVPLVALAHSMGGAITTLYEEQHPGTFKAIALNSPMHEIQVGTLTVWAGWTGNKLSPTSYAIGSGPLDLTPTYDNNKLTSARFRFLAKHDVWQRDVETRIGGITYHWAMESVEATKKVRAEAGKIRTPLLILQAQYDQIVGPDGQEEVCTKAKAAGVSCTLERLDGARHESLIEIDGIRHKALDRIVRFLDEKGR